MKDRKVDRKEMLQLAERLIITAGHCMETALGYTRICPEEEPFIQELSAIDRSIGAAFDRLQDLIRKL